MAILFVPDVMAVPALYPMAVLLLPVVEKSAFAPKAVLNDPDIILASALFPMAVLNVPEVFERSADTPSAVVETCDPFHPLQRMRLFIEIFPFWRRVELMLV